MILSSRRRVPVEQIALLAHVKRTESCHTGETGTLSRDDGNSKS